MMQRKSLDDITFSTPEASFAADPKSPQLLIKRFLDANLPNFPSISIIEESHFTQEDTSMNSDDSVPSPSISLSLPESFEVGMVAPQTMPLGIKSIQAAPASAIRTKDGLPIPLCTQCLILKHHYEDKLRSLRQTYGDADRQLSIASQELQQAKRLAGLSEGGLRQELKLAEDRCNRLSELLNEETSRRTKNEDRASRCDEAERKNRDLQEQVRLLQATVDQQHTSLQHLTSHDTQSKRNVEDLERMNRLLQADKQQLTTTLQTVENRLAEQTRLWEEERSKSLALEAKASKLGDQLLEIQTQGAQQMQMQLQRELQRVREETTRELSGLQHSSREIQDREISILREARQNAEQELALARRKALSLEQQVQDLQTRLTTEQQQRVVESSELRAEVKLRTFEITTLGATFEAKSNQLREAQVLTEKLQGELAAHRTALSRLEIESERERDQLQVTIRSLTDKLHSYEALEVEVDRAVLRVAAKANNRDPENAHPDTIVADIRGIPSHPESRIRQAVFLAQRLLQTEKERDEALQQITLLQEQLATETKAKTLAEDRIRLAAQPAVYLVNKLREEETLRVQLADKVTVLTKDVHHWQRAWRKTEDENHQLRERLTLILRQRGELETIKVMLHHLHYMQEHGSDSDEEEEEEEEEAPVEDDLARKLLPWKPGGGDGEIEFELSSTMEPERHSSVAAQLGLPEETIKQMLANHRRAYDANNNNNNSNNNNNNNNNMSSNNKHVSRSESRTQPEENHESYSDDEYEREDDEDPEMIPLGYVRPEDH